MLPDPRIACARNLAVHVQRRSSSDASCLVQSSRSREQLYFLARWDEPSGTSTRRNGLQIDSAFRTMTCAGSFFSDSARRPREAREVLLSAKKGTVCEIASFFVRHERSCARAICSRRCPSQAQPSRTSSGRGATTTSRRGATISPLSRSRGAVVQDRAEARACLCVTSRGACMRDIRALRLRERLGWRGRRALAARVFATILSYYI